jgi:putative hydroxymethylpyrimidine transport system permease protein
MSLLVAKVLRSQGFRALLGLAAGAGIWASLAHSGLAPSYLLPGPETVLTTLWLDRHLIGSASLISGIQWLVGLALSVLLAFGLCLACYFSKAVRELVLPLLVISQAVPYLVFAPLLLIWLGLGMAPKVTLIVLTCVFPIATVWLQDMLLAKEKYTPVAALLKMSSLKVFRSIALPASLPGFFSGLKVSVSYAVVSAVLAELIGSESGLGVYIVRAQSSYRLDRVMAAVIVIVAASLISAACVDAVRRRLVFWENKRVL